MGPNTEEEQESQSWEIITRLIDLPDSDLRKILPEFQPESVRKSLLSLREKVGPHPSFPSPSQASCKRLFADKPGENNDTFYLYTDGASRGNPGEAGAGIVILDEGGREIISRGYYLGQCTNNEAEYKALIYGLSEAVGISCSRLVVHLDSQLIVRQINGEYKVKAPALKPLFLKVQEMLKSFKSYQVKHVARELNSRADKLANQGIDEAI